MFGPIITPDPGADSLVAMSQALLDRMHVPELKACIPDRCKSSALESAIMTRLWITDAVSHMKGQRNSCTDSSSA